MHVAVFPLSVAWHGVGRLPEAPRQCGAARALSEHGKTPMSSFPPQMPTQEVTMAPEWLDARESPITPDSRFGLPRVGIYQADQQYLGLKVSGLHRRPLPLHRRS